MDKNKKYNEALKSLSDYYNNEIIDPLLLLMEKKGITRREIAEVLGVTRQAISSRFMRIEKRNFVSPYGLNGSIPVKEGEIDETEEIL
jgi:DNA-binding MarR family transcriptional regulator